MRVRNKISGDVYELVAYGAGKYVTELAVERKDGSTVAVYDTVEDLHEYWGTYQPKKPLIKDEKIRKAVRAWAEANDYGDDEEYQFEDFSTGWKSWSLEHKGNGDDNEIHFNGGIDFEKMNHQGYYIIAELCGEEEE